MSIRPMNAASAARLLQQRSAQVLSLGQAYDVFAQLHGYKNWSHYAKAHPRLAAKVASPAGKPVEMVRSWSIWCATFDYDEDTNEEVLRFFPYGSTLQSRWTGRRQPGFDTSGLMELNVELSANQPLSDLLVLESVHAFVPRIEKYGVPPFANEREAGSWAYDELGWGYVATQDGQSHVEVTAQDTGDDSAERVFVQLRVHPSAHAQFMAQSQTLSQDGWRYVTLDQSPQVHTWFNASDSICLGQVFEALHTAVQTYNPQASARSLLALEGLSSSLREECQALSAAELLDRLNEALNLDSTTV